MPSRPSSPTSPPRPVLGAINNATKWWVTAACFGVLSYFRDEPTAWAFTGSVAAAVTNKSTYLVVAVVTFLTSRPHITTITTTTTTTTALSLLHARSPKDHPEPQAPRVRT